MEVLMGEKLKPNHCIFVTAVYAVAFLAIQYFTEQDYGSTLPYVVFVAAISFSCYFCAMWCGLPKQAPDESRHSIRDR
jgi:hypothetical protein